jgi:hypothetical protein
MASPAAPLVGEDVAATIAVDTVRDFVGEGVAEVVVSLNFKTRLLSTQLRWEEVLCTSNSSFIGRMDHHGASKEVSFIRRIKGKERIRDIDIERIRDIDIERIRGDFAIFSG